MKLAGIAINLIVAYHHKFHHQNKKTAYRLLVCSFSLASVTDVMSIFRRRQKIFFAVFAGRSEVSAQYFNSQISCSADFS